MTLTTQDEKNIEMAKEYFRRGDTQDPTLLDLFHPEFKIYIPKFGIGEGPQAMMEMYGGFADADPSIEHDIENLNFVARDPFLAVEGTSRGRIYGKEWEAGRTPGGRFCNMFEFRDGLISRCFVYLDPDYLGQDEPRFRWGHDRKW